MAAVRTFIAIDVGPLLPALGRIQADLRRGIGGAAGRWVRQGGIHLTLKFLGDVPEEKLPDVYRAVDRACRGVRSCSLRLAGTGAFPHTRRPRVIWVGIEEETATLCTLQRRIEDELETLGFERERRGFSPHLTLARIQRRASPRDIEALGRAVAEYGDVEPAQMEIIEVSVIKSDLRPSGAVYTQLYAAPLEKQEDES